MTDSPPLTVTLLGTGTSTGVPVIGCDCPVCSSDDPRDKRLRTSAHIVAHAPEGDVHLQIDTGPDFRQQALRAGIRQVDAVLVTHEHFDHVMGLDDLRPFFFYDKTPIPVVAGPSTAESLRDMFSYIFRDGTYPGISRLELQEARTAFDISSRTIDGAAVRVTPIPASHGALPVLGYRVGRFAYLTDISSVSEASMELLEGVSTLVLDGLRAESHPTHLSFSEAADVSRRVGASETWLIHMTHTVKHADAELLDGLALAFDGLTLEIAAS